MSMRRPMSRKQSDRSFSRGTGSHPRNQATAMRGGYRL